VPRPHDCFGSLSLREVDVARVNEFRRQLIASGLTRKSITNIIGTLHQAMVDAIEKGLITSTPVLSIRSGGRRRAGSRVRSTSDRTRVQRLLERVESQIGPQ